MEPDDSLVQAGKILRSYHLAAASFSAPQDAAWWPGSADPGGGDLLLHGDFAPWNIVVDGPSWTVIDWDSAGPGRPEWELGYALHTFVSMWADVDLPDDRIADRISAFAAGYEAATPLLANALNLAPTRCRQVVSFLRQRAAAGDPAFVHMVNQGHEHGWLDAADRIEARASTWLRLLASRHGP